MIVREWGNKMNPNNPYLKKKPQIETPLMLKVPMYEFDNPKHVEAEMLEEELCIARIPNTTSPTGYTHHVALVYKDKQGDVYSMAMVQHHGELKDGTEEVATAFKTTNIEPEPEKPTRKFKPYGKKDKNGRK